MDAVGLGLAAYIGTLAATTGVVAIALTYFVSRLAAGNLIPDRTITESLSTTGDDGHDRPGPTPSARPAG